MCGGGGGGGRWEGVAGARREWVAILHYWNRLTQTESAIFVLDSDNFLQNLLPKLQLEMLHFIIHMTTLN